MEVIVKKSEIIEQEKKLYEAIKESNINVLDELLHDDLLFIIPSGEVITKEIDLKTYRDEMLQVDELLPEVENLNIIDDLAIITLTMELKGRFDNTPFDVKYRYIRFWKKFQNGFKVVGGSGIVID